MTTYALLPSRMVETGEFIVLPPSLVSQTPGRIHRGWQPSPRGMWLGGGQAGTGRCPGCPPKEGG